MEAAVFNSLRKLTASQPAPSPPLQELTEENLGALSSNRFYGLRRVLSSIASAESSEFLVIKPVSEAYPEGPIRAYLASHAADEHRHSELLKNYLRKNFQYRKKRPTLSDLLFYKTLLPLLGQVFRVFPLLGIAVLLFYENLSIPLYKELRQRALELKLDGFLLMSSSILSDEVRHLKALELILANTRLSFWSRFITILILPLILLIARADVNVQPYALHNRGLRKHFKLFAMDPKIFSQIGVNAAKATKDLVLGHLRRPNIRASTVSQNLKF